jgi:beta-N-acetylhexosaminidase
LAKGWTRAPASAIAAMRAHAEAIGWDLAEAGISVDFWPCLDLAFADGHAVIGDRALGAAPRQVAALGRAALEGLAAAGVAGVIKHLPGHGRARADSHLALPVITADEAALARDLAPFQALCQADAGVSPALPARIAMTGHLLIPAWDAANPATLSPFIIDAVIRRRIGFGGLLVSDDLDMKALSGPVAERAARAIAACCDLALNCWGRLDDMIAIAQALPAMREASAARLAHALARTDVPRAPDPAARQALIATRDALIASWQAL